jgi:vanillate O-demethylase monooxygenase subunit
VVDAEGRAIEMPLKADRANPALCAQSYPILERYGFVWVWIGDAGAADPALVPDLWMCAPPEWVVDGDTYHVRCNYQLLIDNLMDLTHETHVHATSIGQRELRDFPISTRVENGKVVLERWLANVPASPAYEGVAKGGRVNRWQICYFIAPSNVVIDVGVAPVDMPATLANHPVHSFVINAMTPETETTTHYYWGASRNIDIDDQARTERTKAIQAAVFKEDIAILEAQQRSIEINPDLTLRNFSIDAGGVRSRAIIRRLVGLTHPAKDMEE